MDTESRCPFSTCVLKVASLRSTRGDSGTKCSAGSGKPLLRVVGGHPLSQKKGLYSGPGGGRSVMHSTMPVLSNCIKSPGGLDRTDCRLASPEILI